MGSSSEIPGTPTTPELYMVLGGGAWMEDIGSRRLASGGLQQCSCTELSPMLRRGFSVMRAVFESPVL